MLSIVIETLDHEEELARTLATLIPGAIEGLVREVLVLDGGSGDDTHRVADHAGCTWLEETDFMDAVSKARGDWLLVLDPGARLTGDWTEAVRLHVAVSSEPVRFVRHHSARGFLHGLLARRRGLEEGLLIRRQQALSLSRSARTGRDLDRRVSAGRLDAEILPAGARRR